MIELAPSDYSLAEASLRAVPINTLFVQSVLRRHVDGRVFADDATDPRAFYAVHPYGMALLWGRSDRAPFLAWLRDRLLDVASEREAHEWLQVFPASWAVTLDASTGSADVLRCTRVNFAFRRELYLHERRDDEAPDGAVITRTDEEMFSRIQGGVVPGHFWRNAAQFVGAGGGYSLILDGEIAATAFCSFRHGSQLEMGIETASRHRGRGYARRVASALIDDCLRRSLEPVWSCRLENTASLVLAKKLGFEPTTEVPYYRLPFCRTPEA